MSRKTDFPKVMCTQRPDSVSKYIATQEEPGETIDAALVFGCGEYMPDYEGKATPYHQNVQIVSKLEEASCENLLTKYFPSLESDLNFASVYLDLNVASRFLSGECQKEIQKYLDILRDTFDLETRPEPSYSILLEMIQPDILQEGSTGNCMDEEVSQLVC